VPTTDVPGYRVKTRVREMMLRCQTLRAAISYLVSWNEDFILDPAHSYHLTPVLLLAHSPGPATFSPRCGQNCLLSCQLRPASAFCVSLVTVAQVLHRTAQLR
jgi:hypothetical protein